MHLLFRRKSSSFCALSKVAYQGFCRHAKSFKVSADFGGQIVCCKVRDSPHIYNYGMVQDFILISKHSHKNTFLIFIEHYGGASVPEDCRFGHKM